MKFKDLNGHEHSKKSFTKSGDIKSRSKIQKNLKRILSNIYTTTPIIEEFHIPGEHLYLDFYIHQFGLAFEIHGAQHYEYNSFFHENAEDLKLSKERDKRKQEWCDINNITLVVIDGRDKFNEDIIKSKILESLEDNE